MSQVTMNSKVFDNVGPYQYVFPTLRFMAVRLSENPSDFDHIQIKDIQVIHTFNFKDGTETFCLMDKDEKSMLLTETRNLPCVDGGPENIKQVMGLVKSMVESDRLVAIQQAYYQTCRWFNEYTDKWLLNESQRQRVVAEHMCHPDFCKELIEGI